MNSSLLEKAKSGDMSAFSTLYDESYDRVYRYIFHRTLDTIETEEVISDVFYKVLRQIQKFRGNTEGEYYAWIFQICYTTIIDKARQDIGVDSLEEIIWEPSYEDRQGETLDRKEKLREVIDYMQTLSQKERTILTMRIWDECSYEEISRITGESLMNVRKIVSRTLAKICSNVTEFSFFLCVIHHAFR